MVKEVCSPVTRPGSKVGSGQPMSPGARSMPGAGDRKDSVSPQPAHGKTGRHSAEPEPPLHQLTKVIGPED
jgi:hypothetical protein